MKSVDEIHKLRDNIKGLYGDVKREWGTDQSFYDDTFPVPDVKAPHKIVRSGLGRRIIDSPAEQMITSNPQAFFEMLKGSVEISDRLATEANRWFGALKRQNPNPFKEALKNKLLLGVNYIRIAHNESWVTKGMNTIGIPVVFLEPDARVIYASPEEDEEGIPRYVFVMYERQAAEVLVRYPDWKQKTDDKKIQWMEYHDADTVYFEADESTVRHTKNIYGFTPFTRAYSGFGRRAPDGNLDSLIVGDLRFVRALIEEECAIRSDISSVMHLFAHKPKTLIVPTGTNINKNKLSKELSFGAYDLNVIELPEGAKFEDVNIDQPSQEAFTYLGEITSRIERYSPMIMAGFPFGTSGRQQDITSMSAMRRYDTVMENTQTEWARAFEMAYRIIDKVPTLRSKIDGIHKDDLKSKYVCNIKLKASDPIAEDRKAMLGSKLLLNNEIDPITNLIEFKGYTEERARKIMIDKMMWQVLESEAVVQIIGQRAAEKAGMAQELQQLTAQGGLQGQKGITPTNQQRIRGQVQTPTGNEDTGSDGLRAPAQEVL